MLEFLKSHFKFTPMKFALCALITALTVFFGYKGGVISFAYKEFALIFLLTFVNAFKFSFKSKKATLAVNLFWSMCALFVVYVISAIMIGCRFMTPGIVKVALNLLCVVFINGLVFLIVHNIKYSTIITVSSLSVFALANYFVHSFRSREIGPADLDSIGTAINVLEKYTLVFSVFNLIGFCLLFLTLASSFCIDTYKISHKTCSRILTVTVEIILAAALWIAAASVPVQGWAKKGTGKNGYYLNFISGIHDMRIEKPEDYSQKSVDSIADVYDVDTPASKAQNLPNIIVIMNESFADITAMGEVNTNVPLTPFVDSLRENTFSGYALSSIFGGNTANSEYEFLTGHTLSFLPQNSIPYQQHIEKETFSLPAFLRSVGYETFATHPYYSSGWARTVVYPLLGFEKMTFIDDYKRENLVRALVSDRETYEYMLDYLYTREGEKPLFMFGVTMQNHGGYDYEGEDFEKTVTLTDFEGRYPAAEQYLSLVNESDKAVEYLISELENYPEDTVVLFFGDHLPQIEEEFYMRTRRSRFDTLEEQKIRYTVPFFIWANYDIQPKQIELTSLNYLSRYLLEAAGIDLPPYYAFLKEAEKHIPAINMYGYQSLAKGAFIPLDEAEGDEAKWLNDYYILQYNALFDESPNEELFGQYVEE